MKPSLFLGSAAAFLLAAAAFSAARTWTSTDGRTLEGDYVSATDTAVTIKKGTGKPVTIELSKLSQADQDFVKEQKAAAPKTPDPATKPAAKPGGKAGPPITGPWLEHITGAWKQIEGKGGLQCMFYASKDFIADSAQKHPLVIYLHGKGNKILGGGNIGFASDCAKPENYKERPCYIFAPQCPDENGWHGGMTGENLTKTVKDLMKNLPVDEDRVYIVGYSMGAFGTFMWMNQDPKLFAAAVPVAGGCQVTIARNIRKIPLWIFHGEKDDVVPPDSSREIAKALEKMKAPVKYTEFPGEGHGIFGKIGNDPEVHKWMFAQKRK